MRSIILKIAGIFGIDAAVAYTLLGRGWSVVAGPVTLIMIATYLSVEEQGFYYTFTSVLSLQVFFELGLSFVVVQFASHERASLHWTADGLLAGHDDAKGRLASLLRTALKWHAVAAMLMFVVVAAAGAMFFQRHQSPTVDTAWEIPWVAIVAVSAILLGVSPLFAIVEGCGLVSEVAFVRAVQGVLSTIALWLALYRGWGLMAAVALHATSLSWALARLWLSHRYLLLDLFRSASTTAVIHWWREVWPFQWKIALSWASGYFIYQLFSPVLFAYHGVAAAGQLGMTLTAANSISIVGLAWMGTKSAPFGVLVAQRNWRELDQRFFRALWQSLAAVVIVSTAFWFVALYLFHVGHPWRLRIIEPIPLAVLLLATVFNHVVFAEAIYLRAHKEEPLLWASVVTGCLAGLSTFFLGRTFGVMGMIVGYCSVIGIAGMAVSTAVFLRKRRVWHRDGADLPD